MGDGKNDLITVHNIRAYEEGKDVVIKCSCGFTKITEGKKITDESVGHDIRDHRLTSLEKNIGIQFGIAYGKA